MPYSEQKSILKAAMFIPDFPPRLHFLSSLFYLARNNQQISTIKVFFISHSHSLPQNQNKLIFVLILGQEELS